MDNDKVKVKSETPRQKKKKTRYKTSRLVVVILGAVIALALILGTGKFLVGLIPVSETPESLAAKYEEQIDSAKVTLGDNIIYVPSTFEDADGAKYKGMSFLNETDLMFIGDKGFEKRISLDFLQDVAVSEGSKDYEVAVTDEDGSIYKITKIDKTDDAEGFIVILSR